MFPRLKHTKAAEKEEIEMKLCIACGMPMTKPTSYPMQDESKDYCVYCARPDGSMQSYSEKVEGTADFLMQTQGLDKQAAHDVAVRILVKLPAWQGILQDK
jgi:hypothetical protein